MRLHESVARGSTPIEIATEIMRRHERCTESFCFAMAPVLIDHDNCYIAALLRAVAEKAIE